MARNRALHDGDKVQVGQIITHVKGAVQATFLGDSVLLKRKEKDRELLRKFGMGHVGPIAKSFVIIKWLKPSWPRVKLNCDGCSKRNLGPSARGSILRSSHLIWGLC